MALSALQDTVLEFVKEYQLETKVETRLLDLVSELGELSKEYLKGTNYGNKEFKPIEKWEEEFGDVLFSLICIANSTSINIDSALNIALDKYRNRFNRKGSIDSGS